jgi:hypothetical protein
MCRLPCLVLAAAAMLMVSPASAESVFAPFNGAWTGSGQIRLDSGAIERIKCNAYYTQRDSGAGLGIAIRCASTSYKVELRSQLKAQGGRVSGSWEERNFNAAGSVTGQASENRISLSVVGGGMTGTMNVSSSGASQQSVVITTQGTGLKSVNILLSRG